MQLAMVKQLTIYNIVLNRVYTVTLTINSHAQIQLE